MSTLQLSVTPENQQVQILLSWDGLSPIGSIDYLIFYYQTGSKLVKSLATSSLTTNIQSLTNDVEYNFQVAVFQNGISSGTRLTESAIVTSTPSYEPSVPLNLVPVVSSVGNILDGKASLTWNISTTSVNFPVIEYSIYQSLDNSVFVKVATTVTNSYIVEGLTNGTLHYFKVSTTNLIGECAQSTSVSCTPLGLVSAPQNLTVDYDKDVANTGVPAGFEGINLTWQTPTSNGGDSISGYTVKYSLDSSFATNVYQVNVANVLTVTVQDALLIIPSANTVTDTNFYFFRVSGNNILGEGNFSNTSTIIAETIPKSVQNLSISNLNALSQNQTETTTLSWDYTVDESCPLLGYIITYLDHNNLLESIYVNNASPSPSFTIENSGLINGYDYSFSIYGVNMLGSGPTQTVNQILSYYPGTPLLSIAHDDSLISLNWTQPSDRGSVIISYAVYKSSDNISFVLLQDGIVSTEYDDNIVINGSTYYYKVAALNTNGYSEYSNIKNDYSRKIPDAPIVLTTTNSNNTAAGSEATITFTFDRDDLLYNGGDQVSEFRIYRDDVIGTPIQYIPSTVDNNYSFVDIGLINGNDYIYSVSSVNDAGETIIKTDSVSVHISGLSDAPIVGTLTNTNLTVIDDGATINFSGSTAGDNQGETVTVYKLYRSDDDVTYIYIKDILITNLTSFTDEPNNAWGDEIFYKLTQLTANGESEKSVAKAIEIKCRPNPPTITSFIHANNSVTINYEANATNGSDVYTYHLYVDDNYIGNDTTLSHTFNSLVNGQQYKFTIKARNDIDASDNSNDVFVKPSKSPDVIKIFNVKSVSTMLYLAWNQPDDVSGYPNGGLAFTYTVQLYDISNVKVHEEFGIADDKLLIENLITSQQYNIKIWCDNAVDTNYNVLEHLTQIVPAPIATILSWLNGEAQQICMTWNYDTDIYNVEKFMLVISNITNPTASCSLEIVSTDNIISTIGNTKEYKVVIDNNNTFTDLTIYDRCSIVLIAINDAGISPLSNFVIVN